MFDSPKALHTYYEAVLREVKAKLGQDHGMLIGGRDRLAEVKFEDRSPTDTGVLLGVFRQGGGQDVQDATAAARQAFQSWGRIDWHEWVALVRRAADVLDERTFEIAAATSLEEGKNRLEAAFLPLLPKLPHWTNPPLDGIIQVAFHFHRSPGFLDSSLRCPVKVRLPSQWTLTCHCHRRCWSQAAGYVLS